MALLEVRDVTLRFCGIVALDGVSFTVEEEQISADAHIVVFDPEKRHPITAATQHSKSDYDLYDGTEVTGSPATVLLRGNVLVEHGDLVAEPGVGQFVERAAFGLELLPAAAR